MKRKWDNLLMQYLSKIPPQIKRVLYVSPELIPSLYQLSPLILEALLSEELQNAIINVIPDNFEGIQIESFDELPNNLANRGAKLNTILCDLNRRVAEGEILEFTDYVLELRNAYDDIQDDKKILTLLTLTILLLITVCELKYEILGLQYAEAEYSGNTKQSEELLEQMLLYLHKDGRALNHKNHTKFKNWYHLASAIMNQKEVAKEYEIKKRISVISKEKRIREIIKILIKLTNSGKTPNQKTDILQYLTANHRELYEHNTKPALSSMDNIFLHTSKIQKRNHLRDEEEKNKMFWRELKESYERIGEKYPFRKGRPKKRNLR